MQEQDVKIEKKLRFNLYELADVSSTILSSSRTNECLLNLIVVDVERENVYIIVIALHNPTLIKDVGRSNSLSHLMKFVF